MSTRITHLLKMKWISIHQVRRCLFSLCLLPLSTPFAASFDYPSTADFTVVEYTQVFDMIRDTDPIPMLRVFGDGKVRVHFPAYMKLAGDYQMQLDKTQLQQLLNTLEQKNVFQLNKEKFNTLKNNVIAQRVAKKSAGFSLRSDDTVSVMKFNFRNYASSKVKAPISNFSQRVAFRNLDLDAQQFPEIGAITDAAAAENTLRSLLTHKNLVKIK